MATQSPTKILCLELAFEFGHRVIAELILNTIKRWLKALALRITLDTLRRKINGSFTQKSISPYRTLNLCLRDTHKHLPHARHGYGFVARARISAEQVGVHLFKQRTNTRVAHSQWRNSSGKTSPGETLYHVRWQVRPPGSAAAGCRGNSLRHVANFIVIIKHHTPVTGDTKFLNSMSPGKILAAASWRIRYRILQWHRATADLPLVPASIERHHPPLNIKMANHNMFTGSVIFSSASWSSNAINAGEIAASPAQSFQTPGCPPFGPRDMLFHQLIAGANVSGRHLFLRANLSLITLNTRSKPGSVNTASPCHEYPALQ